MQKGTSVLLHKYNVGDIIKEIPVNKRLMTDNYMARVLHILIVRMNTHLKGELTAHGYVLETNEFWHYVTFVDNEHYRYEKA